MIHSSDNANLAVWLAVASCGTYIALAPTAASAQGTQEPRVMPAHVNTASHVATNSKSNASATDSDPRPTDPHVKGAGDRARDERPSRDLLTLHHPIHVISDVDGGQLSELQFSFKYDLIPLWEAFQLFVAYTQVIYMEAWNFEESSPIIEVNYMPEGIARYRFLPEHSDARGFEYVQLGYQHTSNGLGNDSEDVSRKWDRLYVGTAYRFPFGPANDDGQARHLLFGGFRAWLPLRVAAQNDDIADYVGFSELVVRVSLRELPLWLGGEVELEGAFHKSVVRLLRGSMRWGLNLRPWGSAGWFTPHIYVQVFHGHGQRLAIYDERVTNVRAGFMLRLDRF
jgi:outer membrane phospholipase A